MNSAWDLAKKTQTCKTPLLLLSKLTLSVCLDSVEKNLRLHFTFFKIGSYALFTGPASTFFTKNNFKLGPMALFTHLKIILLQCFQFLVISGIQTHP